ncbi:hypothetical protein MMC21_002462 [Puttea exsequens]|nr:hypothetical protein [Puttea exsequens]
MKFRNIVKRRHLKCKDYDEATNLIRFSKECQLNIKAPFRVHERSGSYSAGTHNVQMSPAFKEYAYLSDASLRSFSSRMQHFTESALLSPPRRPSQVFLAGDFPMPHSPTPAKPHKALADLAAVENIMREWLDPADEARPGKHFAHACPVTYYLVQGLRQGDGVNDWVTRRATMLELEQARMPMLEASAIGESSMHDLQALMVLCAILEEIGVESKGCGQGHWRNETQI